MSSRQIRLTQELSRYHFRIDYYQEKANVAADALFCFPQRSQAKEETLREENSQNLHQLQTSLTRANIVGLSLSGHKATSLSTLYEVFIYKTHVLIQL